MPDARVIDILQLLNDVTPHVQRQPARPAPTVAPNDIPGRVNSLTSPVPTVSLQLVAQGFEERQRTSKRFPYIYIVSASVNPNPRSRKDNLACRKRVRQMTWPVEHARQQHSGLKRAKLPINASTPLIRPTQRYHLGSYLLTNADQMLEQPPSRFNTPSASALSPHPPFEIAAIVPSLVGPTDRWSPYLYSEAGVSPLLPPPCAPCAPSQER